MLESWPVLGHIPHLSSFWPIDLTSWLDLGPVSSLWTCLAIAGLWLTHDTITALFSLLQNQGSGWINKVTGPACLAATLSSLAHLLLSISPVLLLTDIQCLTPWANWTNISLLIIIGICHLHIRYQSSSVCQEKEFWVICWQYRFSDVFPSKRLFGIHKKNLLSLPQCILLALYGSNHVKMGYILCYFAFLHHQSKYTLLPRCEIALVI